MSWGAWGRVVVGAAAPGRNLCGAAVLPTGCLARLSPQLHDVFTMQSNHMQRVHASQLS